MADVRLRISVRLPWRGPEKRGVASFGPGLDRAPADASRTGRQRLRRIATVPQSARNRMLQGTTTSRGGGGSAARSRPSRAPWAPGWVLNSGYRVATDPSNPMIGREFRVSA
jgi:hypothetical protein